MAISFRQAFGIHPEAMALRAQRAELLASNFTNADTPQYKARDIDFKAILAGVRTPSEGPTLPVLRTHFSHNSGFYDQLIPVKFRIPSQPSTDGNTVDPDLERVEFASNNIGYQASVTFLDGRIRSLLTAIKGE